MTESVSRLHNLSIDELIETEARANDAIASAKAEIAEVKAEYARRFTAAVDAEFDRKPFREGTVTVEMGDHAIKGEIKKSVKWDSKALLRVLATMPWEQAESTFKIELSVPERTWSQIAIADRALMDELLPARTVELKPQPLKVERRAA